MPGLVEFFKRLFHVDGEKAHVEEEHCKAVKELQTVVRENGLYAAEEKRKKDSLNGIHPKA